MWLRLPRAEFERQKGAGTKNALKALVAAGRHVGLLAYAGGVPVGWCAFAPRDEFPRLEASRVLARVDDRPVWSVVCFYVAKAWRRQGVTLALLNAAVDHVRRRGGRLVEGYPVVPRVSEMPAVFAWPGLVATFRRAGFTEVARRSATRPIVRLALRPSPTPPRTGVRGEC